MSGDKFTRKYFRTTAWKLHPDFKIERPTLGSDIAILDMRGTGFQLNDRVRPICKPTARPAVGDIFTAMGWGLTRSGELSPVLKKVNNRFLKLGPGR